VRQAARGDDSVSYAGIGTTRPVAARRRRTGAIAGRERGDDRSNTQRREGRGGRRPSWRAGFHSAIRREVPIRTFGDWNDPAPGFCEVDLVAHGGTSVAGSFIQTLTMVDVATGWTECLPLVNRDGILVLVSKGTEVSLKVGAENSLIWRRV